MLHDYVEKMYLPAAATARDAAAVTAGEAAERRALNRAEIVASQGG
jgi:hypothetical protein